jgi:hypothetical protein
MLDDDLSDYFVAVSSLRSADPAVRRPALSVLLGLARGSKGPVRASAERALAKEFGPYAVTEGLSDCAGPMDTLLACCADDADRGTGQSVRAEPLTDFDARAAFGGRAELDSNPIATQHLDRQKAQPR